MNCLLRPRVFFTACCLLLCSWTASYAAPAITNLSLRGLTAGKAVTLAIDGSELTADARVVLPVPIASQSVRPGAKANRLEIEITVDAAASPGIYLLRLATKNGISNPLAIGIDRLPQAAFSEAISSLPIALTGSLPTGQSLRSSFTGKRGETISLDVEAQRIGAAIKPVLRLLDSRGTQIAYSPPLRLLGGDARLSATLPADGTYSVELHDQLYRGTAPSHFRLKVGALQFADQALPMAVAQGSKATTRMPGSAVAEDIAVDASAFPGAGIIQVTIPESVPHFTGGAPRLLVSNASEMVEPTRTPGQLPAMSAVPAGVSGVLTAGGEEDRYTLAVTPGQKLRLEVFAQRFGSPLDGVLTVYGQAGNPLSTSDDRAGTSDPLLDFTVPAGVNQMQLGVKDMQDRGGPNFVYRLEARDAAAPDFSLTLSTDRLNIPAGGTQVLLVQATRAGYQGDIDLKLHGLPSGISIQGNKIVAGASIALVTLSAAEGAAGTDGLLLVSGTASQLSQPISRLALTPEVPGSVYQPHLRQQFAIGVMNASPISFAWNGDAADALVLGDKLTAKLAIKRSGTVTGNVRVRLLTTQPGPKKTVKEGTQDKVVDNVNAALRLDGSPAFKPDQTELDVNILVPSDLPKQNWDLVLVADLLATDGKTVTSSIAAPVRTLVPVAPFELELTGELTLEGKAGMGETGKLTGKINRVAAFKQPVVVTLENLPKGYVAPQWIVPADKTEFEFPLTFAFGSKPGPLKDAKVVALAAPVSVNSVRSNSVPVNIKVVAGEKPVAEAPREVFEDDEKFIALLTEGGGKAVPENRDKFSGQVCLRVNGDQKSNAKLPMLGLNVRENPGPGEIRYIRFAWKKQGGNTICLQLNHNGAWGPGGSGREGAKFRYHAGPGGECFGGSLAIDDKVPAKFEQVTRDLFADFGEFTLTGMGFAAVDGQAALFDHIYLGRSLADFDLLIELQK
ncbi:hypothetical protein ETAA8_36050 [Anatilimnocola aggregata]|uniref:Uncharacterized protein n=1 Tax=Anatilimnocola aggregata TaxID=2528021 RepID=A0A517YE57_9BACT|nr:hypothetical protein [Anatilimnocola aggregata]QDU28504.1 hypothetical protein ETAA8_36050 [Anatilimnocola aggregata]